MDSNGDFKIGKFLLDTLTIGMYDDPLCIFREYIQNAADSIDNAAKKYNIKHDKQEIRITLDPVAHKITIVDSGVGVKEKNATKTLLSLGESEKFSNRERGFRGIGRLGGIAYCDKLTFTTKAPNESTESVNIWDCSTIKTILSPTNISSRGLSLRELINRHVSIEKRKSRDKVKTSYFKVELENVKCAKNVLMDIRKVKKYISEVAPVPFEYMQFVYGKDLCNWLKAEVPSYHTYNIYVNDELIHKPYMQTLSLRGGKTDEIINIAKYNVTDRQGKAVAKGWYGVRKNNIGQISSSEGVDCIRVKVGNILLGNKHLLDGCFMEPRFNGYNVGEIHVTEPELIPNARRDNFEDSDMKVAFLESVERDLAQPLVKGIREKSRIHSKIKPLEKAKKNILIVKKQVNKGFISKKQKNEAIRDLRTNIQELEELKNRRKIPDDVKVSAYDQIEKIEGMIEYIKTEDPRIAEKLTGKYSKKEKELIQLVLEKVYEKHTKISNPVKLINSVISALNRIKR